MIIYQPYTYLVGWSKLNKWYYGVRYSKYATPSELWVKYFTSSKYVKIFRKKYGEPDVIQVRRIFDDKYKAILWEQKVLKRLNVEKNNKFLNVKNDTTKTIMTEPNRGSFKTGNKPWNKNLSFKEILDEETRKKRYGRKITEEEKENLRNKNTKRFDSVELREEYRQKAIDQYNDPVEREKHRQSCISHHDKIWINDGLNNKRIYEKDFINFEGWYKGRYIPKETVDKMTASRIKTKKEI